MYKTLSPVPLQFHEWKNQQIKKDTDNYNKQNNCDCIQYLRPKEWYYQEYGNYCNKMREVK